MISQLSVRCGAGLLAVLTMEGSLPAQEEVRVRVYHGAQGETTVTQYQAGNRPEREIRPNRRFYVNPTDTLCFELMNGHPVFYSYGVDRVVDSTAITIPSVPTFAALINTVVPQVTNGAAKINLINTQARMREASEGTSLTAAQIAVQPTWDQLYLTSLSPLMAEVDSAKRAIGRSDQPELLLARELDPSPAARPGAGFRTAQQVIFALPGDQGHFNSTTLAADLQAFHDSAAARMNKNGPANANLLTALKTQAGVLLGIRDAYLAAYGRRNSPRVVRCAGVGIGPTNATLRIARRDSTAVARDTGSLVRIQMVPRYQRPAVELVPLVFGVMAQDVPEFSLVNDTVRAEFNDGWAIRPGAMLLGNLLDFGPRQDISLGAGLGFGLGGDGKLISDIMVGPMFSYRDLFRVGVATGMGRFPSSLRAPATVGQPLPPDAGDLGKLTETRLRRSTFLVFILPGITLPN